MDNGVKEFPRTPNGEGDEIERRRIGKLFDIG